MICHASVGVVRLPKSGYQPVIVTVMCHVTSQVSKYILTWVSIYILTSGRYIYTHLRVGVYMLYMQPAAPLKFHVIMVYICHTCGGDQKRRAVVYN